MHFTHSIINIQKKIHYIVKWGMGVVGFFFKSKFMDEHALQIGCFLSIFWFLLITMLTVSSVTSKYLIKFRTHSWTAEEIRSNRKISALNISSIKLTVSISYLISCSVSILILMYNVVTIDGNYPVFSMVMVIYQYVDRIWRILVTPKNIITYRIVNKYYPGETVNINIQSLLNNIRENSWVNTTKKG